MDKEMKRPLIGFALHGFELEAQLLAIKNLLCRNQKSDESLQRDIDALREQARQVEEATKGMNYPPYQDSVWADGVFESFFHDAANSMAAVGMLAPFMEALFVRIFQYIRDQDKQSGQATFGNQRKQASETDYCNPYFVFESRGRRKDISKGITQLADSVGLADLFPDNYQKTLDALFSYRNKMFHNGFLWPEDEREKFQKMIQERHWPSDWFYTTNQNEKPYIFYMSNEFIEHCLKTIDGILDGISAFEKDRWETFISRVKHIPKIDFSKLSYTRTSRSC